MVLTPPPARSMAAIRPPTGKQGDKDAMVRPTLFIVLVYTQKSRALTLSDRRRRRFDLPHTGYRNPLSCVGSVFGLDDLTEFQYSDADQRQKSSHQASFNWNVVPSHATVIFPMT